MPDIKWGDPECVTAVETPADLENIPTEVLLAEYNRLTGKALTAFDSEADAVNLTFAAITSPPGETAKAGKPAKAPKAPKEPKPAATPKPVGQFNLPMAPKILQHRDGTKRARVIELLSREGGATYAEVQEDIGWDAATAYEGIRLVSTYLGYGMKTDAETGKITLIGERPAVVVPEPKPAPAPKAPKEPKAEKPAKEPKAPKAPKAPKTDAKA